MKIDVLRKSKKILFGILLAFVLLQCKEKEHTQSPTTSVANTEVADYFSKDSLEETPEFVKNYLAKVAQTLQQPIPVMPLQGTLDAAQTAAQAIALSDARFLQYTREPNSKKPTRNEIFGIYPARQSDFTPRFASLFQTGRTFYKVEMYNFAINLSTIALVDVQAKTIVDVQYIQGTQPDIPPHLKELALKIATQNPRVWQALGYQPSNKDALMADTKTALNRSRCERSRHLCVAPTFVKGEKALWTIVDLTDLRLMGLRWTNVGNAGPAPKLTERTAQNEKMVSCFCEKETELKRNNWQMNYMLTSSDGLRIADVSFKGNAILQSAKLVDWHVSYSRTEGFGYSDAVGCPFFSTAAVIAVEPPTVTPIFAEKKEIGFALEQKYYSEGWPMPCNYNYQQRYEFYDDGRFRIATASLGRGCGDDGTYRPVTRVAFAGEQHEFSEWKGTQWQTWTKEQWQKQTPSTSLAKDGSQYKIKGKGFEYAIIPSAGQFNDGGRGDQAFSYVTRKHADKDEGESDLVTIGPCCNTDFQQGPEKFIDAVPEPLDNAGLVFWYVPELKNEGTKGKEYCWAESYLENGLYKTRVYPCYSGPMFAPVALN